MILSDTNVAWMAGLFEGEGNFNFATTSNNVALRLEMCDEEVVRQFHRLAGCGEVYEYNQGSKKSDKHSPSFAWKAGHRNDVSRLIELMMPYFGTNRRTKALEALERISKNKGQTGRPRKD